MTYLSKVEPWQVIQTACQVYNVTPAEFKRTHSVDPKIQNARALAAGSLLIYSKLSIEEIVQVIDFDENIRKMKYVHNKLLTSALEYAT
jgi:hypothetical protein